LFTGVRAFVALQKKFDQAGSQSMSRRIIAAVEDLVFASKILATAESLGVELQLARSAESLISNARSRKPDLIIVDLQIQRFDPLQLGRQLKVSDDLRTVPLIGFFSHVLTGLKQQAVAAGFDTVLPRSVFARDVADILAGKQTG